MPYAKFKIKYLLDFVPIIILSVSAVILVWSMVNEEISWQWKHIIGIIMLLINWSLFFWNHKVGVLALGFTLLSGLFSLLSYSPAISTTTLYKNFGDLKLPIFYGQAVFLLWLLIHFIVSGRYYIGILSKQYWQNFFVEEVSLPMDKV